MAIDAFLFDIGNVLLMFDPHITVRRIAPLCTVAEDEILERVRDLHVPLETGRLSPRDYLAEATRRLSFTGPEEELERAFQEIFTPHEPMWQLVETLAAQGCPLVLLSNTNAIHATHFLGAYPVFGHFTKRVFSHEVGVMKPEAAIYHAARDTHGLDPARTFYIDDLAPNIDMGAQLGYHSHLYEASRHGDLLRTLRGHGFTV